MAEADNLTPAEQIVADTAVGKLTHEQAMLQLLAEIANGVWYLIASTDELLDALRDDDVPRARTH